jgi:hypothetical protein
MNIFIKKVRERWSNLKKVYGRIRDSVFFYEFLNSVRVYLSFPTKWSDSLLEYCVHRNVSPTLALKICTEFAEWSQPLSLPRESPLISTRSTFDVYRTQFSVRRSVSSWLSHFNNDGVKRVETNYSRFFDVCVRVYYRIMDFTIFISLDGLSLGQGFHRVVYREKARTATKLPDWPGIRRTLLCSD